MAEPSVEKAQRWLAALATVEAKYEVAVEAGSGDPSDTAQNAYDEDMQALVHQAAELLRAVVVDG